MYAKPPRPTSTAFVRATAVKPGMKALTTIPGTLAVVEAVEQKAILEGDRMGTRVWVTWKPGDRRLYTDTMAFRMTGL